jgi:hypothetical protein
MRNYGLSSPGYFVVSGVSIGKQRYHHMSFLVGKCFVQYHMICQDLWRSPVHGKLSYHSVAGLIDRIPSKVVTLSKRHWLCVSQLTSQHRMAFWQVSSNIML